MREFLDGRSHLVFGFGQLLLGGQLELGVFQQLARQRRHLLQHTATNQLQYGKNLRHFCYMSSLSLPCHSHNGSDVLFLQQ